MLRCEGRSESICLLGVLGIWFFGLRSELDGEELCRKIQPVGGLCRPVFPIGIAGTAVALLGNGGRNHDQGARFACFSAYMR